MAEIEVVGLKVAVAAFYLLQEAALLVFATAEDAVGADVVGEGGEQKAVLAVGAEEAKEFSQVGAEKAICFMACEVSGDMVLGLDAVAIAHVGIVTADVVPSLEMLDAEDGTLEGRQIEKALRP